MEHWPAKTPARLIISTVLMLTKIESLCGVREKISGVDSSRVWNANVSFAVKLRKVIANVIGARLHRY